MKVDMDCVVCNIRQCLKVFKMEHIDLETQVYIQRMVLNHLACTDYNRSNPELLMEVWKIMINHLPVKDPYKEIKELSTKSIKEHIPEVKRRIQESKDPYYYGLKLAIFGNMIDYGAFDTLDYHRFEQELNALEQTPMPIDDSNQLKVALENAKTCLYVGDNCGEILFDRLFLGILKKLFPNVSFYFSVRGKAIVNDVTREDALEAGIDEVAVILDNNDCLPAFVPRLLNESTREIYENSDVVIAKGQGNYESLSEEDKEQVYFLLMAKCEIIQKEFGLTERGMICKKRM